MTKENIPITFFISNSIQGVLPVLSVYQLFISLLNWLLGATSANAQSIFDIPLSSLTILLALLFMDTLWQLWLNSSCVYRY